MTSSTLLHRLALATTLLLTSWLAGCSSTGTSDGPLTAPVRGQLSRAVPDPGQTPRPAPSASMAATALEYRKDAARHIYDREKERIFKGKLPAFLYAVGTLQVHLDAQGRVQSMHWMRAPQHAPEVIAEIERTVLSAAPFPVATQLGPVTWTDTWLWDESGQFQLDTLTEGQL